MKTKARFKPPGWMLLLLLLLSLGAAIRLVNLDAPPLDFHSTRQLRNSLVARAIYYDSLSSADPEKRLLAESFRRAVGQYEPPILESIVGHTFLLTGGESFAVARAYGTLFWLLAGIALFGLALRMSSPTSALLALSYYLVLPFAAQASRSFQPDPLMTAAFVVGIYFLYRWMEEQTWRWAILGGLFAGFAVLVKIVIIFLVGGAAIAAILAVLGRSYWKSAQVWVMGSLMALPAAGYYILGHPGRSAEYFFSWTVDLIKLIGSVHFYADWLGYVGSLLGLTVLFVSLAGTCMAARRPRQLLIGLWIGYLIYGLVLPFQMITHSYYHLQLVPIVALGLVPAMEALAARARQMERAWQAAIMLPIITLIGYQAWAARSALTLENFSQTPQFWEGVGKAIPEDVKVIALTQNYGFDLMYWGWRKVDLWPLQTRLSDLRNKDRELIPKFLELTAGKDYFLVTAFRQLDDQTGLKGILEGYTVVAQGDGYLLYDLGLPK